AFDAANDHVGGMRIAEHRIVGEHARHPADHPADRGIAEVFVGRERVDLEEVGSRRLHAVIGVGPKVVVFVEAIQGNDGVDRRVVRESENRTSCGGSSRAPRPPFSTGKGVRWGLTHPFFSSSWRWGGGGGARFWRSWGATEPPVSRTT